MPVLEQNKNQVCQADNLTVSQLKLHFDCFLELSDLNHKLLWWIFSNTSPVMDFKNTFHVCDLGLGPHKYKKSDTLHLDDMLVNVFIFAFQ